MKVLIVVLSCLLALCASLAIKTPTGLKSGKIGGRIIGGTPVPASTYKYAAFLNIRTATSKLTCGGTLLKTQWIITAAQCVDGATSIVIDLGSHTLNGVNPNRVRVATSTYILHPDYNRQTLDNDLALVRLHAPVLLNDYINTVNVIGGFEEPAYAIGWGQTSDEDPLISDHLLSVRLSLISLNECKLTYGNQLTDNMLCAVGNYNEGICYGDTGSPLIGPYKDTNMNALIGIASFHSGNGCEQPDPSGFVNIINYEDWIYDTILNNTFVRA